MKTRDFDDLASLWLDDALSPDQAAALDRALAETPGLAARFVRLGRIHGGLRELEGMTATAEPPLRARVRRSAFLPLGLAAAFLIGVVVLLALPEATHGPTVGREGDPEAVLVVGRADVLKPGDRAVRDRLVALGFRVTPIKDSAVDLGTTRGRALLVLSESTISAEVGGRLADAPVPILNCEPNLNAGLRLTTRSAAPGEVFLRDKQRSLRIADPSHPLAAGLGGTVRVYDGREGFVAWGVPDEAAARVVARCDTREAEPAIFGIDAGRGAGATVPARRVGFFVPANTDEADRLTAEGWALFDAAVRWLTAGR